MIPDEPFKREATVRKKKVSWTPSLTRGQSVGREKKHESILSDPKGHTIRKKGTKKRDKNLLSSTRHREAKKRGD